MDILPSEKQLSAGITNFPIYLYIYIYTRKHKFHVPNHQPDDLLFDDSRYPILGNLIKPASACKSRIF